MGERADKVLVGGLQYLGGILLAVVVYFLVLPTYYYPGIVSLVVGGFLVGRGVRSLVDHVVVSHRLVCAALMVGAVGFLVGFCDPLAGVLVTLCGLALCLAVTVRMFAEHREACRR